MLRFVFVRLFVAQNSYSFVYTVLVYTHGKLFIIIIIVIDTLCALQEFSNVLQQITLNFIRHRCSPPGRDLPDQLVNCDLLQSLISDHLLAELFQLYEIGGRGDLC